MERKAIITIFERDDGELVANVSKKEIRTTTLIGLLYQLINYLSKDLEVYFDVRDET